MDNPDISAKVLKYPGDRLCCHGKKLDAQDHEWIRVGEIKTINEALPQGWMLKDDLS